MAQQFLLGSNDLDGSSLARVGAQDSIDAYPAIIEIVRARCGDEAASLFAEPVRGFNRATQVQNVTWFCSYDGTPFAVTQLDSVALRPIAKLLRSRLEALSPLFADPQIGPTLASWLYINSPGDILSVSGQPVLRNWGMVPASTTNSDEAREAVFARTIEPYVPRIPLPPFNNEEAQSFLPRLAEFHARQESLAARSSIASRGSVGPAADALPVAPVVPDWPVRQRAPRYWVAPVVASIIALLVLLGLNFFDVLRYPQHSNQGDVQQAEEGQRATNKALAERLEQLNSANKNVCQMVPGARNPMGAGDLRKLLPVTPERARIDVPARNGQVGEQMSVANLLDSATVLVVNGRASGSGFFLSDRYIVTNHHVVQDSPEVMIANKAIGSFVPAKVIAKGRGRTRGTQDLALLEISPRSEPQPLKVSLMPERLKPVTAAGFPGAVTSTEQRAGPDSLPQANLTTGIVTSHQNQKPDGIGTIIHTAQIGHGNSGGPLVDEGGCVVGVNSWLSFDGDETRNFQTYNQSIDTDELRKFLNESGVSFVSTDTPCAPVVQQTAKPAVSPLPTVK